MFIGHFALGFAAKKAAPAVSLGTLFLACQLADLVWPTLVLLGLEIVEITPGATAVTPLTFVSYPYSHSLVALLVWAAAASGLYAVLHRAGTAAIAMVAALVVSHWVLDVITHAPDMPLTPGGDTRLGLGLWYSLPGTLVVETALFAAGVWLYTRATVARDRAGTWGLWSLVAFLAIIYAANLFGPPPPSVQAIAGAGHAIWLLILWGYWLDRHRVPRIA
ncbi:MAG: hypothetical protein Q8L86_02900 [Vicinamibacterales bacterium]|nr:hypothetical protein [Vicinamibacterales bacterium]